MGIKIILILTLAVGEIIYRDIMRYNAILENNWKSSNYLFSKYSMFFIDQRGYIQAFETLVMLFFCLFFSSCMC